MTDDAKQFMVELLSVARELPPTNTIEALDFTVPDETLQGELEGLGLIMHRGSKGSPMCLTEQGAHYIRALAAGGS